MAKSKVFQDVGLSDVIENLKQITEGPKRELNSDLSKAIDELLPEVKRLSSLGYSKIEIAERLVNAGVNRAKTTVSMQLSHKLPKKKKRHSGRSKGNVKARSGASATPSNVPSGGAAVNPKNPDAKKTHRRGDGSFTGTSAAFDER